MRHDPFTVASSICSAARPRSASCFPRLSSPLLFLELDQKLVEQLTLFVRKALDTINQFVERTSSDLITRRFGASIGNFAIRPQGLFQR